MNWIKSYGTFLLKKLKMPKTNTMATDVIELKSYILLMFIQMTSISKVIRKIYFWPLPAIVLRPIKIEVRLKYL